ncbi:phage tail tube protein [Zhongshania aliphaticivorans]|uniref:phage tail tube protein n=1 Tax=Zhongshania aliphaticivorans TaxID=1470434 RepID=UPI0012E59AF5|nr:hypothetical protein [Zhongshania aliphaticivorans]CAA0103586.1 Uncharacterised protein [Zhongshania aliphaticivorans]
MPILLREQEQVIALKVESTYGTEAAPAGAQALLVHDITVRSLEGDVAELNNMVGFLGHQGSARINTYCSVEFGIYLAGSGEAGVAPNYNAVYEISSHAGVVTADTSVDYTIATSDQDSGTIHYFVGVHKHTLLGVRGKITKAFSTTGLPVLKFSGFGLYVPPAKVPGGLTGVDFTGALKPLPWVKSTVSDFTLHGVSLNGASFDFDQGMPAEYLALTGQEEIVQSSRKGTMSVKFREDDVSVDNWWEIARANTVDAFSMQHGVDVTHEGRIFQFAAPAVEVANVDRSFEKGIAMLTLSCNILATAKGNDYTFAWL